MLRITTLLTLKQRTAVILKKKKIPKIFRDTITVSCCLANLTYIDSHITQDGEID
jgi:hypothetical protein